jgi:lysophospholipase L1-like esterase
MTANDHYKGEDGGLYGKGLNTPPPNHHDAALRELAEVEPLDTQGNPTPSGKVVLISIGMSNTTQEFSAFKRLADADPDKSPSLVIIDGAQGGKTARIWATQEAPWQVLEQRLDAGGVTAAQVQVVWLKQANSQPTRPFPTEVNELQAQLATIVQRIKERYPNARLVYLSSRIYGGYATTGLNPEPHAFEGAFAVRWLIQAQISGDPGLNFDPNVGPVLSPLLLWGPYLWADGLNPRSDGLTWARSDLSPSDGTHPSETGRQKVAGILLDFFKTNELARSWFVHSP